jgi:predicted glycoside hydrolase/deacetylase ChbG (UPF0249 family)
LGAALVIALAASQAGAQARDSSLKPVVPVPIEVRLGYPLGTRLLILHLDDLGVDPAINQAAIALADSGLRISGSVIANAPFVSDLVTRLKDRHDIDVGAHLALTSEWRHRRWKPLATNGSVPTLVSADGYFRHAWHDSTTADTADVIRELEAQIRSLQAAGLKLTHLDSHEFVLFQQSLLPSFAAVAAATGIPMLYVRGGVMGNRLPAGSGAPRFRLARLTTLDETVAADDWFAAYARAIHALPAGASELIVHPSLDEPSLHSFMPAHVPWGADWRIRDYAVLADPRFRALLRAERVALITWRDLAKPKHTRVAISR